MSTYMTIPKNDWEDPRSFIVSKPNGGKEGYEGSVYHNGAEFNFSMVKQTGGKWLYRGHVSAIGTDGTILKCTEAESAARIEAKKKAEKDESSTSSMPNNPVENSSDQSAPSADDPKSHDSKSSKSVQGNQKQLRHCVSGECYCNKSKEEDIKAAVLKRVVDLYIEFMPQIHREQILSSSPSEMTPAVAVLLYLNRFLSMSYQNASEKTVTHYRKAIQKHFVQLPAVSMAEYRPSMISRYLKDHAVGSHARKLMRDFWEFMRAREGRGRFIPPFPTEEKHRLSPQAKQAKEIRRDTLSLEDQDKLYESIMAKDSVTGGDCGIALSLWGGFYGVQGLLWQDVLFDDTCESIVRIDYHQKDRAGATHDYTRPLFVQAALILHRRYDELCKRHSIRKIKKYPIISQERDPSKSMSADALRGYINLALRIIGVEEETFSAIKKEKVAASKLILSNSYTHNITERAGFQDKYGVANFLRGMSLVGSVTEVLSFS